MDCSLDMHKCNYSLNLASVHEIWRSLGAVALSGSDIILEERFCSKGHFILQRCVAMRKRCSPAPLPGIRICQLWQSVCLDAFPLMNKPWLSWKNKRRRREGVNVMGNRGMSINCCPYCLFCTWDTFPWTLVKNNFCWQLKCKYLG